MFSFNWLGESGNAVEQQGEAYTQGEEPLHGLDDFRGGGRLPQNAGKVGLRNLGNTCFMNAGLQCLSHVEPIAEFFLGGRYRDEVNTRNPLGSQGKLSTAFAELQTELWQPSSAVYQPRQLHKKFAALAPHLFEDYDQQDVQEFFAFCLDGLHEDLNRVVEKPAMRTEDEEKADEELGERHGEEFAAALAWLRYLERGKSFLVDLLQGQLRSSLICKQCGHCSWRFDPFLYLSLPVDKKMTRVVSAMEKYLEEEHLTGDERWYCEKCKQKVDARKKIDLWMLPPVLVLHLKRFEFDSKTFRFRKISALLSSPLMLDFAPYCSTKQKDGAVYNIVCIANHLGAFGSGHYTATCRVGNAASGTYHYFDDERVRPLAAGEDVVGPEAYVIFLVRCKAPTAETNAVPHKAGVLKRQTIALPELWPHWIVTRKSVVANLKDAAASSAKVDHQVVQSTSHQAVASRPLDVKGSASAVIPGVVEMPLVECWLNKRGPTKDYGWRSRWCVLEIDRLQYYTDIQCKTKKGEVPLGPSSRATAFVETSAPGEAAALCRSMPHGFVLDADTSKGRNRRLYYFDAGSAPMLNVWLDAVNTVCSRQRMRRLSAWVPLS